MVAPDLTVNTDGNPWVEVFADAADLDPSATRMRVWRFSDGRQWVVRGGIDVIPGAAVLDWEAPFGVPSQYRLQLFDGDTDLGFTDVAQVTVDVDDVWVHNPLVPNSGISLGPIALLDGSFSRNTRPTVGDVVWGEGDVTGTWVGSRRRGLTGAPVGLAVETLADADALQAMLGTYETQQIGVLCIRTPPPVRIPRTLFAAVQEPDEQSVNVQWGGQRTNFLFTATEVRPPHPGITTPLLTYSDMSAAFSTYTALSAEFATYTESSRAYAYAGLAS